MLQRLSRLLSEPVMGLLALVALAVALVPLLFSVSPQVDRALGAGEWLIVGVFALEYGVNLALASDRRAFALDPWRLLDAFIIVAPLLTLLPQVADTARSTPVLRVLRLVRALVAGTRAGGRLRRLPVTAPRPAPSGPPRVIRLRPEGAPEPAAWGDLLTWASNPTSEWLHASNLAPARLEEIARSTGVPKAMIDGALSDVSFARLEAGPRWTALSLGLPDAEGRRDVILVLATKDDVLSLSLHPTDLALAAGAPPEAGSFGPRVVLGLMRLALQRHEEGAARFERALAALEEVPADESSESFFERTFVLKKRIGTARADLWRLDAILKALAGKRRQLPGLGPNGSALLERLEDEAANLHETVAEIGEGLLSLIDLHLNVAAHDTNRFMRLLAIVSVLALLPAVAGGLLGMNLADSPWPVTLGQVAFGTLMLMLAVLYAFLAKGWLK